MANEVTIIVKAKNETKAVFAAVRKDAEKLGTDLGDTINKKIMASIAGTGGKNADNQDVGSKIGDAIGKRIGMRISEHIKIALKDIKIDRSKIDVDVTNRAGSGGDGGKGGDAKGDKDRNKVRVKVEVDEDSKKSFLGRIQDWGKQAGESIRSSVSNGFSTAFSGDVISLAIKGMVGAVAVAFAGPMIGAALVGGILLALGGGAIAVGIASAFKDPRIQGAASELKTKLSKIFDEFGKPFRGPLEDFLVGFNTFLDGAKPNLEAISEALAPVVDALGTGFISALQNAMPGITDAIVASAPFFKMLADHAPAIGQMMGDFFRNIADGGPGATQFFSDLLTAIEKLIPMLGNVISWLSNMYLVIRTVALGAIILFYGIGQSVYRSMQISMAAIGAVAHWLSSILTAVRNKVTSVTNALTASFFRMGGVALGVLGAIRSALSYIKSKTITISIRQIVSTIIGAVTGEAHGGIVGAATGGIHGGLRMVGEAGPELVQLPPGSRVHPTGETQRMMGGGQEGATEVLISVAKGADGALLQAVLTALRFEVRRAGGGSVQRALGVAGVSA